MGSFDNPSQIFQYLLTIQLYKEKEALAEEGFLCALVHDRCTVEIRRDKEKSEAAHMVQTLSRTCQHVILWIEVHTSWHILFPQSLMTL